MEVLISCRCLPAWLPPTRSPSWVLGGAGPEGRPGAPLPSGVEHCEAWAAADGASGAGCPIPLSGLRRPASPPCTACTPREGPGATWGLFRTAAMRRSERRGSLAARGGKWVLPAAPCAAVRARAPCAHSRGDVVSQRVLPTEDTASRGAHGLAPRWGSPRRGVDTPQRPTAARLVFQLQN